MIQMFGRDICALKGTIYREGHVFFRIGWGWKKPIELRGKCNKLDALTKSGVITSVAFLP
jgi:hypothetical protein